MFLAARLISNFRLLNDDEDYLHACMAMKDFRTRKKRMKEEESPGFSPQAGPATSSRSGQVVATKSRLARRLISS
jgi:hypothetical protein